MYGYITFRVTTKVTRHECAGTLGCFVDDNACLGDTRSGEEAEPYVSPVELAEMGALDDPHDALINY